VSLPAKASKGGSVVATQQLLDVFGDGSRLHPSYGRRLSTHGAAPIPVAQRLPPIRAERFDPDANFSGATRCSWAVQLDIEQITAGRLVSRLFVHVLSQGMPVQKQHRVNARGRVTERAERWSTVGKSLARKGSLLLVRYAQLTVAQTCPRSCVEVPRPAVTRKFCKPQHSLQARTSRRFATVGATPPGHR
jgi:hypothetical protein